MSWSYKPLKHMMVDMGIKLVDLKRDAGLNSNAATHISKDEPVNMDALAKLCKYFHCRIEDIVEYIPD